MRKREIHARANADLPCNRFSAILSGMKYAIHHVETVDSTNNAVKALAQAGEPEGYALVADHQSAGKGRLGRSFYSPAGSGLYVSILLRPKAVVSPAALTCLSAVALADTIRSFDVDCRIKWVNDIYCHEKKAAGILTEGLLESNGRFRYAVVGIGVNLSLPAEIPTALRNIMTGVFDKPTDTAFRDQFLDELMRRFSVYYDQLPEITFWQAYHDLQNVFGRRVSFRDNGIEKEGVAESIDSAFRLLIRTGGETVALERGEVVFL